MLFLWYTKLEATLTTWQIKTLPDVNLKCDVLQKVDEPADWVHNLVIVEKKNESLRLCLDPQDLNKVIKENITGYTLHKKYPANLL